MYDARDVSIIGYLDWLAIVQIIGETGEISLSCVCFSFFFFSFWRMTFAFVNNFFLKICFC